MRKTAKDDDLHGYVPDKCPAALLLIDVVNDLEFPGAEKLQPFAEPMAEKISRLRERAYAHQIPVIFVNDNFGQWRSDFSVLVRHCLQSGVRGQRIVEMLQPREEDYFILKPKHSGFYLTALSILLESLGTQVLILTGLAGNNCVLFTANDAYMQQYDLIIPEDCIASESESVNDFALQQMRDVLKADTTASEQIDLEDLLHRYATGKAEA